MFYQTIEYHTIIHLSYFRMLYSEDPYVYVVFGAPIYCHGLHQAPGLHLGPLEVALRGVRSAPLSQKTGPAILDL